MELKQLQQMRDAGKAAWKTDATQNLFIPIVLHRDVAAARGGVTHLSYGGFLVEAGCVGESGR